MNEKIIKCEIPQHVLNNINIFMKRVNLTGDEVPAWIEIINNLNKPIIENESNNPEKE